MKHRRAKALTGTAAHPPGARLVQQEWMGVFTRDEVVYLRSARLGHLATFGRDGTPHGAPVGFSYNAGLGTVDVGGSRSLIRIHPKRIVSRDIETDGYGRNGRSVGAARCAPAAAKLCGQGSPYPPVSSYRCSWRRFSPRCLPPLW